jgi:hypothetical protein
MLLIFLVHEEGRVIAQGKMFHPQGSHPVEDSFGMTTAVVLLNHLLNAGMNTDTVQFNTIHKN